MILHQYIVDNNISSNSLPSFISKFAKTIINSLKNKFLDSEIYNALRIFDPKFLPQKESKISNYGDDDIKVIVEYFENDYFSTDDKKFSVYFNIIDLKQE